MHFEILVEDVSGKRAVDILVPKILNSDVTYRVIAYKGIGRLPKGLKPNADASKRILLDQLPRLLNGYGNAQPDSFIIVVCDLDKNEKALFLNELNSLLNKCNSKPKAYYCLAIEEIEAWYLGDLNAIRVAYPYAKDSILSSYINDSICGTWELLADAIYKGTNKGQRKSGHELLMEKGWQEVGAEKSRWAETITPYMNTDENKSPSFDYFKRTLQEIAIT
jgi:hypothetical protein